MPSWHPHRLQPSIPQQRSPPTVHEVARQGVTVNREHGVNARDKGIKIDGTEQWLNDSRFVEVPSPQRGQQVRVEGRSRANAVGPSPGGWA